MKSFVAILALVAVAAADVSHILQRQNTDEQNAKIISQVADVYPDQYKYGFETSNGISANEEGVLKNAGREDEAISVQGSNSHTAPDGSSYAISYIADENGYQPQGAHLPTPPPPQPIPNYILRAIEYNRINAPKSESNYN